MHALSAEVLQWHMRSSGLPWNTVTFATIDKNLDMVLVRWDCETGEVSTILATDIKPGTIVLAV